MKATRSMAIRWLQSAALAAGALIGLVGWMNVRGESSTSRTDAAMVADAKLIERGAYLAKAGNCAACHTARGGAPYSGTRGIDTPFGTVHAPNITPDMQTGIGSWSADDFWRAMHNGRSKEGRLLYPAFPYPDYTLVTRADSDALYAYLRSVPAVHQPNKPHALRFPYNQQLSLAVWRALYFRPGAYQPDRDKSEAWNRGGYLVRGLGHCATCHSSRNFLGATLRPQDLSGGFIPGRNWYAPALASHPDGGAQARHAVDILKTGVSAQGVAMGPMAEVVFRSTQYLSDADLHAIAVYLGGLPEPVVSTRGTPKVDREQLVTGEKVYQDRCASCHGDQGQGAPRVYPGLRGNGTATMDSPANLVRTIVEGGIAPATLGNPRPYGMPPFGQTLSDGEIAAVATYVRRSWGNQAPAVSAVDVLRAR
jgi:mono/diheme cytochrome c family protein